MAGMEIHDLRTTVAGGRERQTRPLKILNVQKLLGQEPTKSRVVPHLLALLVTSRQWNSRIHHCQVKLSQLRRPELQR